MWDNIVIINVIFIFKWDKIICSFYAILIALVNILLTAWA
jgi:hypothetical protein